MKKMLVILFAFTAMIGWSQELNVDYVSPFHDGMAAVKKGSQWGFINTQGELVIDFRDDLTPMTKKSEYPHFESGRCLISKEMEGIWHFGYIDMTGKIVIEPKFVNAGNFKDGHAIVLKVNREELGRNEVLGKNVVTYSYNEVVIDTDGELAEFLRGPVNLQYDKEFLKSPPAIQSYFVHSNLVAVQTENNTWKLQPIN